MISKSELKKQLKQLGISVKGNHIKKNDIKKSLAANQFPSDIVEVIVYAGRTGKDQDIIMNDLKLYDAFMKELLNICKKYNATLSD